VFPSLHFQDIGAFPHSVNSLENVCSDVRTPDKLVDGVNDTYDGRHMWLAPVFQQQVSLQTNSGIVQRVEIKTFVMSVDCCPGQLALCAF
jgi:hypothetical protein